MNTNQKILQYIRNPLLIFPFLGYRGFFKWIPDEIYLKILFRAKVGHWPNFKNPKTYNEKMQWLKLHDRKPEYSLLVDKFEVRKFITNTLGQEYLIPLIGVWDKFEDIDFLTLPNQFVLKCTHDSGGVVICKDKSKFNIDAARKKINKSLKKNYYWGFREWPYKNVHPRIIAEQYMVDESGIELKDYKIFCFNGEPKALFVATDRGIHETKFDFFDTDFNHLPFMQHYPNNKKRQINRPGGLNVMLDLARKLSANSVHLRTDFYDINGRVYFGELTFTHFSGFEPFEPKEWDDIFGKWIDINEEVLK